MAWNSVVEDLARSRHEVAASPEYLGYRDRAWDHLAKMSGIFDDPSRDRSASRHKGRPAWVAKWVLAVGSIERYAFSREAIDVRRANEGVALASKPAC